MKKIIILLVLGFCIPNNSFAGIPITDVAIEKEQPVEQIVEPDEDGKQKRGLQKINRLYKKLLKKVDGETGKGPSTLNWLSFVLAILGLLLTFVGGGLLGLPMLIAALILGIVGVKKRRPLQGLGIAAIAISATAILIFALLIALVISLFL